MSSSNVYLQITYTTAEGRVDDTQVADSDDGNDDSIPTKRSRLHRWEPEDLAKADAERFAWTSTPALFLEKFLDEDVLEHIVTETLRYAGTKGNHN